MASGTPPRICAVALDAGGPHGGRRVVPRLDDRRAGAFGGGSRGRLLRPRRWRRPAARQHPLPVASARARSLEIGWTWLVAGRLGQGANAEAKLLLLGPRLRAPGLHAGSSSRPTPCNERSRQRSRRSAPAFEGIHRKHMLVCGGELRDSAWYSVIDDDWPARGGARRAGGREGGRNERAAAPFQRHRVGGADRLRARDPGRRHVYVSGTLGVGPDGSPPAGAYAQSVAALERIGGALEALGSSRRRRRPHAHVRRRRRAQPVDVGRAHSEFFGRRPPASTMLGVAGFVGPEYLVEIEAEAPLSTVPRQPPIARLRGALTPALGRAAFV